MSTTHLTCSTSISPGAQGNQSVDDEFPLDRGQYSDLLKIEDIAAAFDIEARQFERS